MICIDCRKALPEDLAFCPSCGAPTGSGASGARSVPVTHHPKPPGWYGDIAPEASPRAPIHQSRPEASPPRAEEHENSPDSVECNAASMEDRMKAWLIDMACYALAYTGICMAFVALSLLLFPNEMMALAVAAWSFVAAMALPFIMAKMEASKGSPGKRAFGLHVVCEHSGQPLPYGRALGREVIRLLWSFGFPLVHLIQYLFAVNEPSHRAWHDRAMNCRVITGNLEPLVSPPIE